MNDCGLRFAYGSHLCLITGEVSAHFTAIPVHMIFAVHFVLGAIERIQTSDPCITNAMLYQLSYDGMVGDRRFELLTSAM